ncbi:MAG TPA: hypothetical protein VJH94_03735 [Candidatus Paceibacterota bacterium]
MKTPQTVDKILEALDREEPPPQREAFPGVIHAPYSPAEQQVLQEIREEAEMDRKNPPGSFMLVCPLPMMPTLPDQAEV